MSLRNEMGKRETQDPPSQPEDGAPDLIGLTHARVNREVPLPPLALEIGDRDGAYSNFYSLHFMGVE
jgi:hypothetical protein